MLHVVPILCILLFVGFVEYRLQEHLKNVDKSIDNIKGKLEKLEFENKILKNSISEK